MRTARECAWVALAGVVLFLGSFAFRPLDERVGLSIVGTFGFVTLSGGLAYLGGVDFLLPAVGFGVVLLGAFGRWRGAARLALVTLTAELAARGLKELFERERPDYRLIDTGGFSFPSGHATMGAAIAVMLAWYATRYLKGRVVVLVALGGALAWAILMALSRLVLGVHYLSDVTAGIGVGLAVGGAVLALTIVLEDRYLPRGSIRGRSSRAPGGLSTPAPPPPAREAGPPPPR